MKYNMLFFFQAYIDIYNDCSSGYLQVRTSSLRLLLPCLSPQGCKVTSCVSFYLENGILKKATEDWLSQYLKCFLVFSSELWCGVLWPAGIVLTFLFLNVITLANLKEPCLVDMGIVHPIKIIITYLFATTYSWI